MDEDGQSTRYRDLDFGRGRVGLGTRPAVLVVDLQRGFIDDGLGTDHSDVTLARAGEVLDAARSHGLPVVYVRVAFAPDDTAGIIWREKVPPVAACVLGTTKVEIHPAIAPRPDELVIDKRWASAFFQTPLHDTLQGWGVDAVIVIGTSTGGCVRASVVDAAQHDYRVTVVGDAVEDRSPESHRTCLIDFDAKYADVLMADELVAALAARSPWPSPPGATARGGAAAHDR